MFTPPPLPASLRPLLPNHNKIIISVAIIRSSSAFGSFGGCQPLSALWFSTLVAPLLVKMAAASTSAVSSYSMAVNTEGRVSTYRPAGNGVDNLTLLNTFPPKYWNKNRRFKRYGEGIGGVLAQSWSRCL